MKNLLIVAGVIVAGFVLLIVSGLLWNAAADEMPVTDMDKAMLITSTDLLPYFEGFVPDAVYESFQKLKFLDDSIEVAYCYDSTRETDPYLGVRICFEGMESDANMAYKLEWTGQRVGVNLYDSKFEVRENNSLYSAGDRSRFGDLYFEDRLVGHILVVQKGCTVFSLSMSGFIIDDPGIWQELLNDKLSRLSPDGAP